MAKKFPLEIVIAATDKATAVMQRVAERFDRFNAPLHRLKKGFDVLTEKSGLKGVGDALHRVGSAALQVGRRVATGMAVASAAIGAFVYKQLQSADAIGDTAARLNISTDALQAYRFGFGQADVEAEAFTASIDTLNKNLGLAKIGMGKALPLFRSLGLDPKKFRTIDELLPALAERLSRISDPSKRAAIATRLLGDAGAQMAVKLAEGPKALKEMMAAARAAGAIIGGDTVDAAGKLDALLKRLRATLAGVAGNAMGRLYPALIKIAEGVQQAIVRYQPQIEAFAAQFARNLPTYIENTVDALRGLRDALRPAMDLISFLVEKFGAGNVVMGVFTVLIGGKLIGALLSLGTALVRLVVLMSAAFSAPALIVAAVAAAVAAAWLLYKNWDKVSMAIGDSIDWVREKFADAWSWAKDAAVSAFEWIVGRLKAIWDNSPLGMMFHGLSWVANKIGSAGAATASAPPIGQRVVANGPPNQQVTVQVDLSNLPPGTRTKAFASDGVMFDLNRGYAMPGAR